MKEFLLLLAGTYLGIWLVSASVYSTCNNKESADLPFHDVIHCSVRTK